MWEFRSATCLNSCRHSGGGGTASRAHGDYPELPEHVFSHEHCENSIQNQTHKRWCPCVTWLSLGYFIFILAAVCLLRVNPPHQSKFFFWHCTKIQTIELVNSGESTWIKQPCWGIPVWLYKPMHRKNSSVRNTEKCLRLCYLNFKDMEEEERQEDDTVFTHLCNSSDDGRPGRASVWDVNGAISCHWQRDFWLILN